MFKLALQIGENHPLCQGVAKFVEILEEKSDGRMKLELYYGGALGDKATTVQGLQSGTIDGGMLMSGVIADYGCEELGVFTLPYLLSITFIFNAKVGLNKVPYRIIRRMP